MPKSDKEPFHYEGFVSPNTTPVPDDVFDLIAPQLTEAELRVLLYVIRRTFGFKKNSDAISQAQMATGITTRDGRVLDHGTGMSKSAVWRGCKGLVEKGVLVVEARTSEQGDSDVNIYQLRFRHGVTLQESDGYSPRESPVTLEKSTQETVNKRQLNKNGYISKKDQRSEVYDEAEHQRRIIESVQRAGFQIPGEE